MMYHLLDKTYRVGMLANGRIEAVDVEKIINQDVVQKYKDAVPFILAFILKFTVKFEKPRTARQHATCIYQHTSRCIGFLSIHTVSSHMFANNALLGGGVRIRVWIREQRKIKRRSKAPLSL